MSTAPAKKKVMPRGGRKGGAMFPRISLGDMLPFAKKLVSKTHTAVQPIDVVLMGVFGSRHAKGKYGMSAAKQFGLMSGDGKTGFSATDLAKRIDAAPEGEEATFYRQAALKPAVFRALFDTYHGDTVTKSKLKQRAADLNVHPDETATCADLYISTMATAGLVSLAGDQVVHLRSSDLASVPDSPDESDDPVDEVEGNADEADDTTADTKGNDLQHGAVPTGVKGSGETVPKGASHGSPRAVFHVNVTLDSSLDIEKLQKQLDLLKRFGAI